MESEHCTCGWRVGQESGWACCPLSALLVLECGQGQGTHWDTQPSGPGASKHLEADPPPIHPLPTGGHCLLSEIGQLDDWVIRPCRAGLWVSVLWAGIGGKGKKVRSPSWHGEGDHGREEEQPVCFCCTGWGEGSWREGSWRAAGVGGSALGPHSKKAGPVSACWAKCQVSCFR